MSRRGFTLLEVMMAALLGALLIGACVAVFGAIDRSNRLMDARFHQSADLQRLRLVMQRAMSSLVLDEQTTDLAAAAAQPDAAPAEPAPGVPPRLLLEVDPSEHARTLARRTPIAAPGLLGDAPLQRLEVVVAEPPVPEGFIETLDPTISQVAFRPMVASVEADARERQEQQDSTGAEIVPVAVRGVFELRPDWATRRVPRPGAAPTDPTGPTGEGPHGWTLWWRPLPAPELVTDPAQDPRPLDPTRDVNAVPLVSGLLACEWRAFQDRERKREINATTWEHLPAYMELSVLTTSGLRAEWMFEVGWTTGPEVIRHEPLSPAAEEDENQPQNRDGAGAPDAPGGRGSPPRPLPGLRDRPRGPAPSALPGGQS